MQDEWFHSLDSWQLITVFLSELIKTRNSLSWEECSHHADACGFFCPLALGAAFPIQLSQLGIHHPDVSTHIWYFRYISSDQIAG